MAVNPNAALVAEPYDYAAARAIARDCELPEPVAVTLVRRGLDTVDEVRRFLAADERHPPSAFTGMGEAVKVLRDAIAGGRRVTIHGDYDVDGVASTSILVEAIRELGGDCDWFIPDRLAGGYGLSTETVEALAARGTEVLVTVDCGIGSRAEIARARELGLEAIVTDHHRPPDDPAELPECTVLHPEVSGYPYPWLCGTGVAHKLAQALREASLADPGPAPDADLVALATVADLVPLTGENRRLVREGIIALRATRRPGLRALMAASGTDPATVTEQEIAFRLAPRINAAGRLYRADAGVELMLCSDPERAAAIAEELNRANGERRTVEREVTEAAEEVRRALPDNERDAAALVLAGEGWHPGVVGIVASRLVERHGVPVVLISFDGDSGRGSGRSVPGFDLLAGLEACGEHLTRFGGHAAAAGLELDRASLPAFREAFAAHAAEAFDADAAAAAQRVDAMVGVGAGDGGIGLSLAEGFERLAPFGMANPDPVLLVPSGVVREVRPLGEEGRHARFRVVTGRGSAPGVAFGVNGSLAEDAGPSDLAVRLELDRWNGGVLPRVVLRSVRPQDEAPRPDAPAADGVAPAGCGAPGCPDCGEAWWRRFELGRSGPLPAAAEPEPEHQPGREVVDRRGGAAIAAIAELVSTGEPVLALCADAARRSELARRAADPHRFGGGEPVVVCGRCPDGPAPGAAGPLVLADWASLADGRVSPGDFRHVVLVDPPPSAADERAALAPVAGPAGTAPFATGFAHLAWGAAEAEFAERVLSAGLLLRAPAAELYRAVRDAGGELGGEALTAALAGRGKVSRAAEVAGRCVRVLEEAGVCAWTGDGAGAVLRVVSSERTDLERSGAFRACAEAHAEALRFLRSRAQTP